MKAILFASVLVFLCSCSQPKYSQPMHSMPEPPPPEGVPMAPGSYAKAAPSHADPRDNIIRQQDEVIRLLQKRIAELEAQLGGAR